MAASDGEKIRHISEFGIVAERVEPDPAKSQLQTCRNQMVCTNRIGVIGPTGHRAWEEPSPLGFETDRLPFPQFENGEPVDFPESDPHPSEFLQIFLDIYYLCSTIAHVDRSRDAQSETHQAGA